jgi:hypothetical protein
MTGETLTQKQRRLADDIARQRGEFAQAYQNLQTPIRYGEQALRGFGFLRQNPWVLTVVPAAFSITSSIIGMFRRRPVKSSTRRAKGFARDAERDTERESKSLAGHVMKWGGHGWRLFRLYGRARKFFS